MRKNVIVLDLFKTCESRWEMEVDIKSNDIDSGDTYRGCMAETPWYLLDQEVKHWCFNNNVMEIVINQLPN